MQLSFMPQGWTTLLIGCHEALCGLEDEFWNHWRGRRDDGQPHTLAEAEMALRLKPFGIRSRTIWPLRRRPADTSARGYLRSQFEDAWASYCPAADTPTHSCKINYLHRS